jgi:hypothetical protein
MDAVMLTADLNGHADPFQIFVSRDCVRRKAASTETQTAATKPRNATSLVVFLDQQYLEAIPRGGARCHTAAWSAANNNQVIFHA